MNHLRKNAILPIIIGIVLLAQGCGGGSGGDSVVVSSPTAITRSHVEQHLSGSGVRLLGESFTTFRRGLKAPSRLVSGSPFFDGQLGLWVVPSISSSSFTETFYEDQAGTMPAGSADYTLNLSTKTLSGSMSVTKGKYAGLSGTYSQSVSLSGTKGNYAFTLPSGTDVTCQFAVVIGSNGKPSGTASQSLVQPGGYSEKSNIVYTSDGSMKVTATDSNGYGSTLNFAADLSGTGRITGPDPGLPATASWDSVGTGQVTFANGLVVYFADWKFPVV